jgi:transcription antitermination protein NusB
VLRLATYELLFDPNAQPLEVVINEAIELARRFGSADSAGFVNGVLDKIAKMKSEKGKVQNEEQLASDSVPPPE